MTYIEELKAAIKDIRTRTKAGELPLEQRIIEVEKASSRYAVEHARLNVLAREKERLVAEEKNRQPRELPFNPPDANLLEQLANLVLHEDLTDTTAWKSRQSEYPFLSDLQLARRRDGVHQRKNEGGSGELNFTTADFVGIDGKDHRVPLRKMRTLTDNLTIDENTRSRNKERRRKYNEFTKIQPVITYNVRDLPIESQKLYQEQ
ncbi:hypothetical protein [Bacillus sp. FSL K6-3431]|uniref:hypothetical protein n=1 Tax=Bacillus sp. FSL K6-3431 TaxID=2921500 RepID=UPI0030F9AEA6